MVRVAILFEANSQNIFYSGQEVIGHVQVETTEQIKTRGVRVEVSGKAHVKWTERDRRMHHSDVHVNSHTHSRTYTGSEKYMDLSLYLTRSENNENEILLQPGVHTFPFSIRLPPTLPSSFQGKHGSITYKMKGIVDRIMRFDDKAEIEITVVRLLDLNQEPQHLKGPMVTEIQHLQTSGCYSCSGIKGIPQINMTLNRGCFVSGETMIVGGQVANRTNTRIDSIVVDFIQRIEFWANSFGRGNHRSKVHSTVLASVMKPAVDCGQNQNWDAMVFNISALPTSRLDGCSIINVMYYIQLTVNFASCCSSGTANQDIIIGNIPLHTSTITSQPPSYSECSLCPESNNTPLKPGNCGNGGMCNSAFASTGDKIHVSQPAVGSGTVTLPSPGPTIH